MAAPPFVYRVDENNTIVYFRCDSPSRRGFIELAISPWSDGAVQFESRLVREERRPPSPLLDSSAERTDTYVTICGWCNRVQLSGEWVEVARDRRDVFAVSAVSHLGFRHVN